LISPVLFAWIWVCEVLFCTLMVSEDLRCVIEVKVIIELWFCFVFLNGSW
jgi:hypothetical protein